MRQHTSASPLRRIAVLALPPLLVFCGWLWARITLSGYQSQVGSIDLQASPLASHYHHLSIDVPFYFTLAVTGLAMIPAFVVLYPRRLAMMGLCFYMMLLASVTMFLFVRFEFEAFD
jgi:hypothetical protein